ncbi:MAG: hypothetical protein ABI455_00865 [Candidatus Dormiibacterota bacterium]
MKLLVDASVCTSMRRLWIAIVVLLTACGGSVTPTAVASPSASPQPTASKPLLFAALEAKATGDAFEWNTVAIANLDGIAQAKTAFTPMPVPYVGCAGASLPPSAHVASGKVFFADGTGQVRSLGLNGQIAAVTTIPFTGTQQMLSFAVSPDGSSLLAAVFTIPGRPATGDACTGAAPFAPGNFTLDVYSAQVGGASHLLYHEVLASSSTQPVPNVMAFIGWDKVGPEATYPTQWATQGGGPHPYGVMAWVDPSTGKVSRQLSNPDSCLVWDIGAAGDFVCTTTQVGDISVRRPDGTEIWGVKAPANSFYESPYLSPQEGRVAAGGGETAILGRDGAHVSLTGFGPQGWLDDTTVIGGGYESDFTYVRLNASSTVVDIGFKGKFIGTIQS